MTCPQHGEYFTNFCCIKKCLTALCPECIDDHNKRHKIENIFPEVDTLKKVKAMCTKQILNAVNVLEEETARVKKFSNMSADDILNDARKDLSTARAAMHKSIDDFYDSILEEYTEKIRQNISRTYDFRELEEELRLLLLELRALDDQMRGKEMLTSLKKTCSLDMADVVLTYQDKVQRQVEKRLSLPIDVDFSEKDKREFHNDLTKYIRLKNKDIGITMPEVERNRLQEAIYKMSTDETNSYFSKKFKDA